MIRNCIALAAALVLVVGTSRAAELALTGDNTKITFVGAKPGGKHEGGFKTLTGAAKMEGADLTTLSLSVDIDMESLFSDDAKLTGHLKSPDFFSVKNNPKSKFVSSKVEKSGDGYTVTGTLTMCGKSKEISFPAKIESADGGLNLTASFTINRLDWGMTYGKGKIDDNVSLTVAVTAKK